MMSSGSRCEFTLFLIVAGLLYQVEAADGANEYRRCYNTSEEMHCFDLQYDTTKNNWLTAPFDNARQRCNVLNSTLITIKDEETNNIVKNYLSDPYNPIRSQSVWTDAYRISDYNNTHTWHWVNSALPNIPDSAVSPSQDNGWYVASLEFRSSNGRSQFYLMPQQPHIRNSYVCEYPISRCPSNGSNARVFADRCYTSVRDSVSWYEARNRCLKDGGDLASFANVSSINFASWLGSDPTVRFWIGLRFTWYVWKDSGLDVKFAKWFKSDDWDALCLVACSNCVVSLSWVPTKCDTAGQIYVVCHSVTSLQKTTLSTASATTLSVTAFDSITTQVGNLQSNNPGSSPIALAVGIGVGVGVPVIVAIIVIIICAVRCLSR